MADKYFADIQKDPQKNSEVLLRFQSLSLDTGKGNILVLAHDQGGGADMYLDAQCPLWLAQSNNVFILRYVSVSGSYCLRCMFSDESFDLELADWAELENLLRDCVIDQIIVNELVTYPALFTRLSDIRAWKWKKQARLIMLIHDYFAVSPSYNLISPQDWVYAREGSGFHCDRFYEQDGWAERYDCPSIGAWRQRWGNFLLDCDEVRCFSEDSRRIMSYIYPELRNITLIPHVVSYMPEVHKACKTTETLNIGVLGVLVPHKGRTLVREIGELLERENRNIKIILIGYWGEGETVPVGRHIEVTGKYNIEDLPQLVLEKDIDLFLMPSICPETFSFTTEEIIKMGLPIACLDMGAPAERVRNYEKGLVLSSGDPQMVFMEIFAFARALHILPAPEEINDQKEVLTKQEQRLEREQFIRQELVKQQKERFTAQEQIIQEQQLRIATLEAQNRGLTETAETRRGRIEQLEAQNRDLAETAEARQERIVQLEAQNRDLAETAEARQKRIVQLEAQNRDLAGTAEARQARIETLEAQNRDLAETAEARQTRINALEVQNRYLGESFDTISNAFFWKITKPARFTLDVMKWAARPHAEKGLVQKGLYSLRTNGVRTTWQKAMQKIYFSENYTQVAKQALFSEEELARQRKHHFLNRIKFSIVVPLYNTPERFLREMIESVQAQTYGGWELCMADGSDAQHGEVTRICREYVRKDKRIRYRKLEKNLGISGNTNACLEMVTGEYIGLFDHDDLLHPAALFEVMRTIENTGADFVYTDESTFHDTPEDAYLPHFKPDFAPDNLRANNYICHFTVFKRSLLDQVGPFDPDCDGSQDHDMVLRLTEKARRVAHIPEILYYWRAHAGSVAESTGVKPYVRQAGIRAVEKQLERLGLEGKVEPVRPGLTIYRTRYAVRGTPKVSILIPNYEHIEDLRTCLNSIFKKTTWPDYEIVIVENNSSSRELFAYYESLQREHANVRVVTWEGAFNYSAINNYGAQFCTGDYLLLLNNDIEVITPNWIEEMLMFAQRSDVGAVGAMLYYPNETIQHAGVCLGMGGVAGHYFQHVKRENLGYMGRLLYPQDMAAVTAACMLLRRDVWDKVGGLDEDWAVAFNDVDLCMRIRKAGYLIVWTPYAELTHYESKSRRTEDTPEKQKRFEGEVLRFQSRWAKELEAGDPYYNPNFTLDRSDFSVKPDVKQYDAR